MRLTLNRLSFKQWVSNDKSTLETFCSPVEECADTLCEKVELLCLHLFIATDQVPFYASGKATLKIGEFLVSADLSENYSFILQDAAEGFHSNNSQTTLHPFVAYYR